MNHRILVATAAVALLTSPARAAEPEYSTATQRMLSYGSLAVMTDACSTRVTPDQDARIKAGLAQASDAQKDLSEGEFTAAMRAVGAQLGPDKARVCAHLTPDFVELSLQEVAAAQ